MNFEKVKKHLQKKCNARAHYDLMENIDLGGSVVFFEESLFDCNFLHEAIICHIDKTLDSLWGEALEDVEDVWETRMDIKNFIDKYYVIFAYVSDSKVFDKSVVSRLYDVFVRFDQKFKDCIWECVGFKF